MISEQQIEIMSITWFQDNGYEYIYGPDIAPDGTNPERKDYTQIILTGRFLKALKRINPHIPEIKLEESFQILKTLSYPVFMNNNREFHKILLNGIKVEYSEEEEQKNEIIQLIDFEDITKNQFLVVNQFAISGGKRTRRPDLIIFINGLPIAIIELKNPAEENTDIWDAYNQLQTYKEEVSDLFIFNEALVISDGINARIGSLSSNKERFLPWRTIKNEKDKPSLEFELEKVIKGFFDRELFLDYIRYFILFDIDGDDIIKKIAGYHQFHAVREAVRASIIASANSKEEISHLKPTSEELRNIGNRKGGVVWHTQGSGKSISMCCFAGKLIQQPEMHNPTIVVVTDRNDLDGQLFQTFSTAQDLLKQTPEQADSRDDLREKLAARQSGGIIFTTIQKFSILDGEEDHPVLSNRNNIIVISDEAHRSQYGLKARYNRQKDEYQYGYAKYMRDALPNASFIGFTGTPVSYEDKDTRAVFGEYVSIYDIQDAVIDKATVPIYYESRLAKLDINQNEIDKLNEDVEEVIEDEEDIELREQTKSRWAELAKLVGAEPRLKEVAADLVMHFENRRASSEGKAMIVCMSREICVNLYNEIVAIKPEWHDEDPEKGEIKIVMTGSASDRELFRPHIYTKQTKKRFEKRFKDPSDKLSLVIVRDMWLTGFDVPCCNTMYVDKPMKGHNLMQAIARVNRVFKDKPGGLIVDYIGIASELKKALKIYTDAKGKGAPTLRAEEALSILIEKMELCHSYFVKFDYSEFETKTAQLLVSAVNYILGEEDGKKKFLDVLAAINKAFSLCCTLDAALELRKEIAFLNAIKAVIIKYTNVERKQTEEEKNTILKRILDNAIISDGVADIYDLAGLQKPNIGLLSDDFLEELRNIPGRNLAVELLEKLLRDGIKSKTKTNIVQEKKYSERLLATLRRYHNGQIETAQVIEELIEMAKDFQNAMKRDEELGLSNDEVAFYDALADNESAVNLLGDEILKKIAIELTETLRKNITIDWQVRDSVRAHLRNLVRRLLKKYKYPPDHQQRAIDLILEQATGLADGWSGEES